jgi:hypothetical protein
MLVNLDVAEQRIQHGEQLGRIALTGCLGC